MPLVLLRSCTRFDVLNVLGNVCAFSTADTVPSAQHGRRCTVRSLHHQFTVRTRLPWFAQDTCFQ